MYYSVYKYIHRRIDDLLLLYALNGIVEVFENSDWSRVDYDINQCQRLYTFIGWPEADAGRVT